MEAGLIIALTLIGFGICLTIVWTLSIIFALRLVQQTHHDEIKYATTSDGFKLSLFHYIPQQKEESLPPVILCHGLACNRFTYDVDGVSLAQYLQSKGRDVWVVELRGAGLSDKSSSVVPKKWQWHFDTYVDQDIKAIIDGVCFYSQSKEVDWVGHSMGGSVIYAYLGKYGDKRVRRCVTIASPSHITKTSKSLRIAAKFQWSLSLLNKVPIRAFLSMHCLFLYLRPSRKRLVINQRNIKPKRYSAIVINLFDDVSSGIVRSFAMWINRKSFDRKDLTQPYDYLQALSSINTPFLIIAGLGDKLVPLEAASPAFKNLGSEEKAWIQYGIQTGCQEDYGHIDLVVGKNAETEVFPDIEKWLAVQ